MSQGLPCPWEQKWCTQRSSPAASSLQPPSAISQRSLWRCHPFCTPCQLQNNTPGEEGADVRLDISVCRERTLAYSKHQPLHKAGILNI